jgi:site-specific DNA recombinase
MMQSTNGHGPRKAVLYARVSTDEQGRSGYSLAQQLEALREYAAREGYEVLEEVTDPGQSGASLERPGMDRVRNLVDTGGVAVVLAQDRDRFAREPAYHYLLRQEFEEYGTQIRSLNDRGDGSPEGELIDGILDQLAKFERAKLAERSRRGKLRKAREGKVVAGALPNFGFRYNVSRDNYVLDEETMPVVRRILHMVGLEKRVMNSVKKALEAEGVTTPTGNKYWHTRTIRTIVLDDVYRPHTHEEIKTMIAPEVADRLDPNKSYGIWWFNRERISRQQVAESSPNGRVYRGKVKTTTRPKEE